MRLRLAELRTTLSQEITVGDFPLFIRAIRPHLLVFNKVGLSGSLQIQIQDAGGGIVASSEILAISALTTAAYAHKFYRFYITTALRAGATYRVVLVPSGGYSFAEAAYIGWCTDWEGTRTTVGYSPRTGWSAPFDMEIWARKDVIRGAA